ncbi:PaaI family thioesterase [Plastorhodobacter daqingensis]|uniref:Medium/long-chain acyl-CoA thioesterase YigI n=1 Tax=Plastorhodobacter daqingensis TaxID=1387281 RepID=A0ABW2URZ6_9RHOB
MGVDVQSFEKDGWQPLADDTFIGGMGEVLERRRDGLVEIALPTTERHKNLSGVVHGGVVMALFDRAIGVNCRDASPNERMATATITINLMRQVRVGDFIEFRCRLRKKGRKAYFADAEAWVADKLVATATGVWMKVA